MHGWQTWYNWFLDTNFFFVLALFWSFYKYDGSKKCPKVKKIINIKNQFLHARQPREGIFVVRSHWCCIFTIVCQTSNGWHYSNFENWCLKMKSRGLNHTYILWKSWLLLDFQQLDPLYYVYTQLIGLVNGEAVITMPSINTTRTEPVQKCLKCIWGRKRFYLLYWLRSTLSALLAVCAGPPSVLSQTALQQWVMWLTRNGIAIQSAGCLH